MSNVVNNLPKKRPDIGQDQNPEQPQAKCAKLDAPQSGELDETADADAMSTAVTVPDKRHDLRLEQPPEKHGKIDDLDVDDSDSEEYSPPRVYPTYCEICDDNVGHRCWNCPNKSKGMGLSCLVCHGPCKKKNDPDYDPVEHRCVEVVKQCLICWSGADHWADECPNRSDGEVDDDSDSFEDCLLF